MKKVFIFLTLITLTLCSGCTKDEVLDFYERTSEQFGDLVLTIKSKLKGNRDFGEDHYTGIYEVVYKDFTGEEVVFGGTTIERENEDIHIKLEISESKGDLKIIFKLKEKEEVLAMKDGTYEYDFNVKDGSNYLIIKGNNYSGKVNIKIE